MTGTDESRKAGKIDRYSALIHQPLIRAAFMPFYFVKKKMEIRAFQSSPDAAAIRKLKGRHEGERCFVIGNGPSLTGEDLDLIKEEISFASNRIYAIFDRTGWRPDYYFCLDQRVMEEEWENIRRLRGFPKFAASCGNHKFPVKEEDGICRFVTEPRWVLRKERYCQRGISTDVSRAVSYTLSVTCVAMEFAIYMGFREIVLLGVDHTFPMEIRKNGDRILRRETGTHFQGAEPRSSCLGWAYIEASTSCYQAYEDYAKAHGIRIVNATRGGSLEVFERKELKEVLRE